MYFLSLETLPSYVVARGERAMAAFQRAKATGKTLDKRVLVSVIGQDRAGKTSLVRSLKGENFIASEASTDGVQMHQPLKNPGDQPWKNSVMQDNTVAYHHKHAEFITKTLMSAKPLPLEGRNLMNGGPRIKRFEEIVRHGSGEFKIGTVAAISFFIYIFVYNYVLAG